jgi:hypothetical protein
MRIERDVIRGMAPVEGLYTKLRREFAELPAEQQLEIEKAAAKAFTDPFLYWLRKRRA